MTKRSPAKRRHLASSPFPPDPEPIIPDFAIGDLVSHDTYGVGRVSGQDDGSVTVDFGSQTVRVPSPYTKLEVL